MRPPYWIQLSQTMRHRQPHYRCHVRETASNRLVAVTPTLWPLNAGCGKAAAIKCMDKFRFCFRIALEANVRAACLECFEVRAA